MNFTIEKSIQVLERALELLKIMLQNILADWTSNNEGGDSWSAHDVIGHLINGEITDWILRVDILL